jgi:superfamily II DNA helicase RecQ
MSSSSSRGRPKGKNSKGRAPRDPKPDLAMMMYGYGDEKEPLKESLEMMEGMMGDYIHEMCRQVSTGHCRRNG